MKFAASSLRGWMTESVSSITSGQSFTSFRHPCGFGDIKKSFRSKRCFMFITKLYQTVFQHLHPTCPPIHYQTYGSFSGSQGCQSVSSCCRAERGSPWMTCNMSPFLSFIPNEGHSCSVESLKTREKLKSDYVKRLLSLSFSLFFYLKKEKC